MQSKLPVRVTKKHGFEEENCAIFKIMIDNPNIQCNLCTRKTVSSDDLRIPKTIYKNNTEPKLKSTQTAMVENLENEIKSFGEVHSLLHSINITLESILNILKEKKKDLYARLQEENVPVKKQNICRITKIQSKNKVEKIKKRNDAHLMSLKRKVFGWPDISRIYGEPWIKHCMQKVALELTLRDKNALLCPTRHNFICATRPSSCPNINYFQTLGKLFEKKRNFGILGPGRMFSLAGQGDLNIDEEEKRFWEKDIDVESSKLPISEVEDDIQ